MVESKAEEAGAFLRRSVPHSAPLGMILGSGLGGLREAFRTVRAFPYESIPHFPVSTVHGHRGELVLACRRSTRVWIMDGRIHTYEGYRLAEVTLPIAVFKRLGVKVLIVTNAAGAISGHLEPGDLMLIEDHIDLMWKGVHLTGEERQAWHRPYYSSSLLARASELALRLGIPVKSGTLLATSGPSYETPSEVEFARKIGADAATMSTIPEVTRCHQLGIAVLGISVITNKAAKPQGGHEQVVESARRGSRRLEKLVLEIADSMQGEI
jgi:purine-nucleoside phosphorylase